MIVILLCCLVALGQVGLIVYLPTFPEMATTLQCSIRWVDLTLTVYLFAMGLGQPIFGVLSDRWGRQRLLLLALGCIVVGTIGVALSTSIDGVLLMRCIQGLGSAGVVTLARASANDRYSGQQLLRVLAYTAMTMSAISLIGPTIGGHVGMWWGWRVNFFWMALVAVLIWLWVWLRFSDVERASIQRTNFWHDCYMSYITVVTHRPFLYFGFGAALTYSVMMAYYTVSPVFFEQGIGISAGQYGLLFLITSAGFLSGSMLNSHANLTLQQRAVLGLLCMWGSIIVAFILGIKGIMSIPLTVSAMFVQQFGVAVLFTSGMTTAVNGLKIVAGSAAATFGCTQIVAAALLAAIVSHVNQYTLWPMAVAQAVVMVVISALFLYGLSQYSDS